MIPKNVIPINFGQGIDNKTDDKLDIPGKLTVLQNGVFLKNGKINKRNGLLSLSNLDDNLLPISSGTGLATLNKQLISWSNDSVYSYDSTHNARIQKGKNKVISSSLTQVSNSNVKNQTMAIIQGTEVYAYVKIIPGAPSALFFLVKDSATGNIIKPETLITPFGTNPKIVSSSYGLVVISYVVVSQLRYLIYNYLNPASYIADVIAGDVAASPSNQYDVYTDNSNFYYSYFSSTGNVKVVAINPNGIVGDGTNGLPAPVSFASSFGTSICIFGEGNNSATNYNLYVAFYDGSFYVRCFTVKRTDFTTVTAPHNTYITAGASILNLTGVRTAGGASDTYYIIVTLDSKVLINANGQKYTQKESLGIVKVSGGITGTQSTIYTDGGLVSAAVRTLDSIYFMIGQNLSFQSSYYLVKLDENLPLSNCLVVLSQNLYSNAGIAFAGCLSPLSVNNDIMPFAVVKTVYEGTFHSKEQIANTLFKLEYNLTKSIKSVQLGNNLLIAGAKTQMFDGDTIDSAGMNFPENISIFNYSGNALDNDGSNWIYSYLNAGVVPTVSGGYNNADGTATSMAKIEVSEYGPTAHGLPPGTTYLQCAFKNISSANLDPIKLQATPYDFTGYNIVRIHIIASLVKDADGTTAPISFPSGCFALDFFTSPTGDPANIYNSSITHYRVPINIDIYNNVSVDVVVPSNMTGIQSIGLVQLTSFGLATTGSYYTSGPYTGQPIMQSIYPAGKTYFTIGNISMIPGALAAGATHTVGDSTISPPSTGLGIKTCKYTYISIYEWVDSSGQIHRSSNSSKMLVNVIAPSSNYVGPGVSLNIPTLKLTQRKNINIKIYRSLRDSAADVYYLLNSSPITTYSDFSNSSVYYLDNTSDSDLATSAPAYTSGGILGDDAVPASIDICQTQNRAFLINADNDSIVSYSKYYTPGYAVEFPINFTIQIPGGKARCIAGMDDKIVIFKDNEIYVIAGGGPNNLGSGGGFSEATLVVPDVGCSIPKSIVAVPMGLMFKSKKGYYLLDRQLTASYIGAEVEDFNNLNVSSAICVSDKNQVRITHSGSQNAIVYDYFFHQWSVFTGFAAIDSCNWNGLYVIANPYGGISKENVGVFLDDGIGYSLKIITGWLSFAQVQGFQRIWKFLLLGEYKSTHNLLVSLAYNYIDTFDSLDMTIITGKTPYQLEVRPRIQQCESIKISIEDNTITGESYSITNMAFEAGIKKGLYKSSK